MTPFERAFDFTLNIEGAYSDNAADHGGPTNHGITQATYDHYRARLGEPAQPVTAITDAEVTDCYYLLYWTPAHCDQMSPSLAICVFDWAVNHGVDGAIRTLQEALAITADGVFGPLTKQALASHNQDDLCREYNALRDDWYREEVKRDPTQEEFLTGWLHRVDRLEGYVESLDEE